MSKPLIGSVGLLINHPGSDDARQGRTFAFQAVNYIVRGSGVYRDADSPEQVVAAGSMISIRPGVWHRFQPDGDWDEYFITFDHVAARSAFGNILVGPPGHLRGQPDPTLAEAFETLHGLWLQRHRHYEVRSRQLLHEILVRYFDAWHGPMSAGDDVVAQALGLMKRSLGATTLDLRRFAHERGLSYERFRKRFAGETGLSPHRYWLDMKLRQAGAQLRSTRRSVREIAAAVGIADPYYFSRLFTKFHGSPPNVFRKP